MHRSQVTTETFLSPPATLNPEEKLSTFMPDTLRGPTLRTTARALRRVRKARPL